MFNMTIGNRSVMVLYSGVTDLYSHQVGVVLAEKAITFDVIAVDPLNPTEDLIELNPYNTVPTLVDADLVLYESLIIMEYLDERFPHPPLLPVYPTARAKNRLMMHRIKQDWYSLVHTIENASKEAAEQARKKLTDSLTVLNPVFADQPYFLSKNFSLVDCCIAPLLWRLPALGITLPPQAQAVIDYGERIFTRNSFKVGLMDIEYDTEEDDI